jgi:hypothetical protein
VLAATLSAVALALVTVALAGGIDPFAGLGAFDQPQQPGDRDWSTLGLIGMFNEHMPPRSGVIVPESLRALGQLSTGERIYVAKTTDGELCTFENNGPGAGSEFGAACGWPPPAGDDPTTVAAFTVGVSSVTWGLTRDGVVSARSRPTAER